MEEFYFSELKLSQIVIKILIDVQCKENGQTFFTWTSKMLFLDGVVLKFIFAILHYVDKPYMK